jgi:hypothetical protein
MRDRLLDFLPLLLAVGLVAVWFGFQQPLPWLGSPPQPQQAVEAARPAMQAVAPTQTVTRASAISALCDPTQPEFLGSLAALKLRLGARMGQAVACEQAVDAQGNTQQQTSTGLAYYRRDLNLPVFTNGWDHWALSREQLLHWTGNEVEPPADATTETQGQS